MKTFFLNTCLILGIVVALIFAGCRSNKQTFPDPAKFFRPPVSASIHAWWHWVDNAITKEGITKDLEAMKKEGISTVTILNIGILGEKDLGVTQIKFNSPEWFDMFDWALHEANRLGMKVGAHNCDGWSSSGGPWITPELSMKRCTWSKTLVSGGRTIDILLPQPVGNLDFYRDINVVAFPVHDSLSAFQLAKPEIRINDTLRDDRLYDGNPLSAFDVVNGTTIDLVFKTPFPADKIALHARKEFEWSYLGDIHYKVDLETSMDGKAYKKVFEFAGPEVNKTAIIQMPAVKARYYRFVWKHITNVSLGDLQISELELLHGLEKPAYNTEIPFHLEKTVTTLANSPEDLLQPGTDSRRAVPENRILDLTRNMSADGRLKWKAPAGTWEILRVGYTTTGAENGPATKAGTGLECDKMDTSALNLHFRSFPAKLIAHAGKYTGNTFQYLFIDSWECKYSNWTWNFAEEFEKRRHYPITDWLPVICGVTVNDQTSTERFLHDFRKTIAELIEDNYYKHFNTLCHRYGLESDAEVIYGGTGYPPLDILKSNSYVDVPMFEYWAGPNITTGLVRYRPSPGPIWGILPIQAASLYGKQVIPAESYTGYANYSETPWDLKLYGDRAYSWGINQVVLHSYVHQPFEKKPGITLGEFGQSFNRHNPWWDYASQWFTYLARSQYILQKGTQVADILYFIGDRFYDEMGPDSLYKIPYGYNVQFCNLDVLVNHCCVKKGRLVLDNGISYSLLLLPNDSVMEYGTLKRLAELVRDGAVVAGQRPTSVTGIINYTVNKKNFRDLTRQLWGNDGAPVHQYGKGRVFSPAAMKDILAQVPVQPDFSVLKTDGVNPLFLHKQAGETDFYFIVNQEDRPVEMTCSFRISGRIPEIWDPEYGTVTKAAGYSQTGGRTSVKLTFSPKEALFFIFRHREPENLPERKSFGNKYTLTNCTGTLKFNDLPGKAEIPVTRFGSWTDNPDPDIKYYSGPGIYRLHFDLPYDQMAGKKIFLSLDTVMVAYKITLNGKYLGCSDFPGYRFDVSGLLREKDNQLEVTVVNTWRNRIIGDLREYGKLKNCWTTAPVEALPQKDMPLQASGILGPITLCYEQ